MYAVYKQSHPPTGIEHCVYCNFFKSSESNLVVAAVNQIHVYRLNPDTEVSGNETANKTTFVVLALEAFQSDKIPWPSCSKLTMLLVNV